eukprot:Opistho-2@4545
MSSGTASPHADRRAVAPRDNASLVPVEALVPLHTFARTENDDGGGRDAHDDAEIRRLLSLSDQEPPVTFTYDAHAAFEAVFRYKPAPVRENEAPWTPDEWIALFKAADLCKCRHDASDAVARIDIDLAHLLIGTREKDAIRDMISSDVFGDNYRAHRQSRVDRALRSRRRADSQAELATQGGVVWLRQRRGNELEFDTTKRRRKRRKGGMDYAIGGVAGGGGNLAASASSDSDADVKSAVKMRVNDCSDESYDRSRTSPRLKRRAPKAKFVGRQRSLKTEGGAGVCFSTGTCNGDATDVGDGAGDMAVGGVSAVRAFGDTERPLDRRRGEHGDAADGGCPGNARARKAEILLDAILGLNQSEAVPERGGDVSSRGRPPLSSDANGGIALFSQRPTTAASRAVVTEVTRWMEKDRLAKQRQAVQALDSILGLGESGRCTDSEEAEAPLLDSPVDVAIGDNVPVVAASAHKDDADAAVTGTTAMTTEIAVLLDGRQNGSGSGNGGGGGGGGGAMRRKGRAAKRCVGGQELPRGDAVAVEDIRSHPRNAGGSDAICDWDSSRAVQNRMSPVPATAVVGVGVLSVLSVLSVPGGTKSEHKTVAVTSPGTVLAVANLDDRRRALDMFLAAQESSDT